MKLYFIADIAANHDKSLNRCYDLIGRAKDSGANAVKFQHYKAESLISKTGFARIGKQKHQAGWDLDVYETFNKYSLPYEWTEMIANYCKTIGIDFMSTPYDLEALNIIDPHVKMHKIGSGDIDYYDLLDAVNAKKKKVLLGCGASEKDDVYRALNRLKDCPVVLMQCNTNYTRSLNNIQHVNLNVLKTFPECETGISDHNKNINIITGAVAIGATYIERHFTDGHSKSPDNDFAMKPHEWREMVNEANEMRIICGKYEKEIEPNEEQERIIQRRTWYANREIKAGEIITKDNAEFKRPALMAGTQRYIIGDLVIKDIPEGELITDGHIQET